MKLLPEWLTSMALRRAPPAAGPDFADMGTAFGLDASMAPESADQPAAGEAKNSGPAGQLLAGTHWPPPA